MLPKSFLTRMEDLLGEDFDAFIDSYDHNPSRAMLINERKISRETFLDMFPYAVSDVPYCPNGLYLDEEIKIGNTPYHHAGMMYMQEPAAMAVVAAADIPSDAKVCDVCAAPGGKTIGTALRLGDGGFVLANDVSFERAKALCSNVERLGLKNVIVSCESTTGLVRHLQGVFDVVIVDAPCSGEGMFRKDAVAKIEWSDENVRSCAIRQRAILENAELLVKQGGLIIYSTCTFSVEENESVISWFLSQYDYKLERVKPAVEACSDGGVDIGDGIDYSLCRRFYPHKMRGEGQFVALMRKQDMRSSGKIRHIKMERPHRFSNFSCSNLNAEIDIARYTNKDMYYIPISGITAGLNILRGGVDIGREWNGRFEPAHGFFTACGDLFLRHFELDDQQIMHYLHGEEIQGDFEAGYGVVTFHGIAVGGAKSSIGRLRNLYPRGLRIGTI